MADEQFTIIDTISCQNEASFNNHLQGIATDGTYYYWSFAQTLAKTDLNGNSVGVANKIVAYHHGDLAYYDGKLYVAYAPNFVDIPITSSIKVYSAADLSLIATYPFTLDYSFGGLEIHNGKIYVAAGTHQYIVGTVYVIDLNTMLYEETKTFGDTYYWGLQCIGYANGRWWAGSYDSKRLAELDNNWVLKKQWLSSELVGKGSWAYGIKQGTGNKILCGVDYGDNQGKINAKFWYSSKVKNATVRNGEVK